MKFQKLELKIHEPDRLHGIGIEFDSSNSNKKITHSYNAGIINTCSKFKEESGFNLGQFHQTGRENEPGYHYWEFLGSAPSTEEVGGMFENIHSEAKNFYNIFYKK